MGKSYPPLYKEVSLVEIVDKISDLDEQINVLAIEREKYVEAFKEKVKEDHLI